MNFKKILLIPTVFTLVLTITFFNASSLFSAESIKMNDVADPVLQEVINSFMSKTPRFITSIGNNVFVADAPINRKSLLMVLYEYNKSLKIPSANELVTKNEFDEFSAKILSGKYLASQKNSSQNLDITSIIQSLEPNMPTLLNNSLSRSSVYNELRNDVANINEEINVLKNSSSTGQVVNGKPLNNNANYIAIENELAKTQADFNSIKIKIDSLESKLKTNSKPTNQFSIKDEELSNLKTSLSNLETKVLTLLSRLDNYEKISKIRTNSNTTLNTDNNAEFEAIKTQLSKLEANNNKVFSIQNELSQIKDQLSKLDKTQQSNQSTDYSNSSQIDNIKSDELKNRLYKLETENAKILSDLKNDNASSIKPSLELKTEISRTQNDVEEIKRRIGAIESDATISGKEQTTSDKSTLTKLSVGLSLVAALFIAR